MSKKEKAPSTERVSGDSLQKESITTKDGRARTFATIVYPESAPENWLEILGEAKTPVLVSPLHDKDINPTGEEKKPHFHVLAYYEGKKSIDTVKVFFESFGGVGCEVVQSLRGYARYLCHLDNPEKHQYNPEEVRCFGGIDYISTIGLPTDKYKSIREMIAFCKSEQIYAFADLVEYASENRMDWFRILCDSGALIMREYLKSTTWKMDRMYMNKGLRGYNSRSPEGVIAEAVEQVANVVEETGEVLL